MVRWSGAALALCLVFLLTRCGQQSALTPGTFNAVYNQTLKTACIECHVPGGSAFAAGAQLDFSTQAKAFSTLTTQNVSATSSSGICSGVKIVTSGSPAASYLAAVLISTYWKSNFVKSGCTPYATHLSDQNLSADEKSSLVTWITNGAKNN